MKTIIFNIGLENNPLADTINAEKIHTLLHSAFNYSVYQSSKIIVSEYLGKPERTLITKIEVSNRTLDRQIIKTVRVLCLAMTQDCIAVKIDGRGVLAYTMFYNGIENSFNDDYFINI